MQLNENFILHKLLLVSVMDGYVSFRAGKDIRSQVVTQTQVNVAVN